MMGKSSYRIYYFGLIFLYIITFLLYLKSFKVGFISDDFNTLFDYKVFLNPFYQNRFLPIQGIYFWLINLLGQNPLIFRIIFLFIQFINIFLVFRIIHLLTNKREIALLSAFVFTFFYRAPMVFYWLSGSLEIILLNFCLASILFFICYLQNKNKKFYFLSLIFFIFALLSKESAIVLPLILFLVSLVVFRLRFVYYLPFVVLSIVYFLTLFLTADFSSTLFLSRGGYHLINFKTALIYYANILAAFLPIKFDQEIISKTSISIIIIVPLWAFFFISLFIKKIPKIISLFLGALLIITLPYALFSPFGFQDKYLFLSSFAFSGLVAFCIFKPTEKFHLFSKIIFLLIFCLIWGSISFYLIFWRANQWLIADEIIRNTQQEITKYCSTLTSKSKVYLINFPRFVNNQVFILNNGLGNMIKITCRKRDIGYLNEIIDNPKATSFLKSFPKTHPVRKELIILVYEEGKIRDYSDKYKYFKEFLHNQLALLDLKTIFNQVENWEVSESSPNNKIKISRREDNSLVLRYHISSGGWVGIYHKNVPIIRNTSGISVDVFGDFKGATIYFDLINEETEAYFRFSQKLDWGGWKTLKFSYQSCRLIGSKIKFEDVDALKISLDTDKDVKGEIKIKNFQEY